MLSQNLYRKGLVSENKVYWFSFGETVNSLFFCVERIVLAETQYGTRSLNCADKSFQLFLGVKPLRPEVLWKSSILQIEKFFEIKNSFA